MDDTPTGSPDAVLPTDRGPTSDAIAVAGTANTIQDHDSSHAPESVAFASKNQLSVARQTSLSSEALTSSDEQSPALTGHARPSHRVKKSPTSSQSNPTNTRRNRRLIIASILCIILIILVIIATLATTGNNNSKKKKNKNNGNNNDNTTAPTSSPTPGEFNFDQSEFNLNLINFVNNGFEIEVYYNLSNFVDNSGPRTVRYSNYNNRYDIIYVGSKSSSKPYIYAIVTDRKKNINDNNDKTVFKLYKAPYYAPASLAISPIGKELYISLPNTTIRCDNINIDKYVYDIYEEIINGQNGDDQNWLESKILGNEQCKEKVKVPLYSWDESAIYNVRRFIGINPYTSNNNSDEVCIANGVTCDGNECIEYFNDTNYGLVSYLNWPHGTILCVNVSKNGDELIDLDDYENDDRVTVVAQGVRNCVGFDWHPDTHEMWFTDTGIDGKHDDYPDDELNRVPSDLITNNDPLHYGFPWCHTLGSGDPHARDTNCVLDYTDSDLIEFANDEDTDYKDLIADTIINCSSPNSHVLPIQPLGPHVTALGMRFYDYTTYDSSYGTMYPMRFNNTIFIAQRGSFSRADKIGYRIAMVSIESGDVVTEHNVFADGWLNLKNDTFWGRPVDLEFLNDGSMVISDDSESVLYRIYYNATNGGDDNQNDGGDSTCDFSYADTGLNVGGVDE